MPDEIEVVTLQAVQGTIGIGHLLKNAGLVTSTSEAVRQIKQGAVRVDGERVDDPGLAFAVGNTHVFQVGKRRFARIVITA